MLLCRVDPGTGRWSPLRSASSVSPFVLYIEEASIMGAMSKIGVLVLPAMAAAQNLKQSIPPSVTVSGETIQNPTLLATPFVLNVEDMWDLLVGPVTEAYYTTTVSPTPVPSSSLIPPPPLYYPPFPPGPQYPMEPKNESWSFPKDFWYTR